MDVLLSYRPKRGMSRVISFTSDISAASPACDPLSGDEPADEDDGGDDGAPVAPYPSATAAWSSSACSLGGRVHAGVPGAVDRGIVHGSALALLRVTQTSTATLTPRSRNTWPAVLPPSPAAAPVDDAAGPSARSRIPVIQHRSSACRTCQTSLTCRATALRIRIAAMSARKCERVKVTPVPPETSRTEW
jgi:hypothetical protein